MQFDLNSSQGVVGTLQAVRNSSLSPEDKNSLRDLIFLYANGGGDQGIKDQLEEQLKRLDGGPPAPSQSHIDSATNSQTSPKDTNNQPTANTPTPPQTAQPAAAIPPARGTSDFTSARPVPVFKSNAPTPAQVVSSAQPQTPAAPTQSQPVSASKPAQQPTPPAPETATPSQPIPPPSNQTGPTAQAASPATQNTQPAAAPVPPPVQPAAAPATQQPPTPVSPTQTPAPNSPPSASPQTQPVSTPAPAQQPTPPPMTPPAQGTSAQAPAAASTVGAVDVNQSETNSLGRIRQIKAEVNAAVGNPVNLIDINNEVGREYMNALLGAMKKLNAGAPGELTAAMDRLEKAFVSVKETVAQAPADRQATPSAPTTANSPSAQPTPAAQPSVSQPPTNVAKSSIPPATTPVTPPPAQPSSIPNQSPQQQGQTTDNPEPTKPPTDTQSLIDKLTANLHSGKQENIASDTPKNSESTQPATAPVTASTPPSAPATAPQVPGPTAQPLFSKQVGYGSSTPAAEAAEVKPGPASPPAEKSAQEAPATAPDEEVTSGLKQLLSEWSLFKSSGLFGTGPNGIEHPLYLKLKDLPIAHILAGRYEGSKPEIKQSIADYMNGWRYEQGIVYQPGETFEVYLRRVIKQIIDSQKQKSGS